MPSSPEALRDPLADLLGRAVGRRCPATPSVVPKIASAMPASPHAISSMTTGIRRPVGSPKALATKSSEYRPILAASSMIGHGVSSRSSHSWAAGRITSSAKSWTHFWIWSWSSLRSSEKPVPGAAACGERLKWVGSRVVMVMTPLWSKRVGVIKPGVTPPSAALAGFDTLRVVGCASMTTATVDRPISS